MFLLGIWTLVLKVVTLPLRLLDHLLRGTLSELFGEEKWVSFSDQVGYSVGISSESSDHAFSYIPRDSCTTEMSALNLFLVLLTFQRRQLHLSKIIEATSVEIIVCARLRKLRTVRFINQMKTRIFFDEAIWRPEHFKSKLTWTMAPSAVYIHSYKLSHVDMI